MGKDVIGQRIADPCEHRRREWSDKAQQREYRDDLQGFAYRP